jgi:hypothetical protein
MHWSWFELMATPVDVVEDIWRYMNTEAKYHNQQIEATKTNIRSSVK